MKRISIFAILAACTLATPSYAAAAGSCSDVRSRLQEYQNGPVSKAFREVALMGSMYKLGNVSVDDLRKACDDFDDFEAEMEEKYQLQRRFILDCSGTITLGNGTKLGRSNLQSNQDELMSGFRRDHPEICAIARGEKPMPDPWNDKLPADEQAKLDAQFKKETDASTACATLAANLSFSAHDNEVALIKSCNADPSEGKAICKEARKMIATMTVPGQPSAKIPPDLTCK